MRGKGTPFSIFDNDFVRFFYPLFTQRILGIARDHDLLIKN